MRQPYMIPGDVGLSFQGPSQRPGGPSAIVRVVAAIWMAGALGFIAWKFAGTGRPAQATVADITPLPASKTRDLLHHVEAVALKLDAASSALRRAEEHITRTIPSMERNYLSMERRRLDSALALAETSKRQLAEARLETELILNSVKEQETK